MAKSYPAPGSDPKKRGAQRETNPQQRAVGVYDRPESRLPWRLIIIAVIVVVLLLVIFLARSLMTS
jgi:hypothetical protein